MKMTTEDSSSTDKEVTPFALQYAEEVEGAIEDLERKYNSMGFETLPPPID